MVNNFLDRTAGTALAMNIAWPAQDILDGPGLLNSVLILGGQVLRSFGPVNYSSGTVERVGKLPVLPIGDSGL